MTSGKTMGGTDVSDETLCFLLLRKVSATTQPRIGVIPSRGPSPTMKVLREISGVTACGACFSSKVCMVVNSISGTKP